MIDKYLELKKVLSKLKIAANHYAYIRRFESLEKTRRAENIYKSLWHTAHGLILAHKVLGDEITASYHQIEYDVEYITCKIDE